MFRRRLGNYLLKCMWKLQHRPADLTTYIRNRRQEEDLAQTMEVRTTDERTLNPHELLRLASDSPEPNKQVSPPRGRPSRSWVSPLLKRHEAALQDSFSALDFRGNQALGRDQLKDLFRETLSICEVELNLEYIESFGVMLTERCGGRNMLSFPAFVGLVEDWALRTPAKTADFAAQLRKTIQEYEEIMQKSGDSSAAARSLETLISSMKSQLAAYLSKRDLHKGSKSLEVQSAALAETFSYYAKHIRLIGTTPTFDQITANNSVLTIEKFFKFCADKDLMGRQTATKRRLAKEEIMQIFRKNAAQTRNMELTHFKNALDDLAMLYYDQQYDEIEGNKGTEGYKSVEMESLEEKRRRLYRELRLGEGQNRKNQPVTTKKPSPEPIITSEDAIRRPRFHLSKDTRSKLDEMKTRQVTKSVDPRPVRPVKVLDLSNIQVKAHQGYSQRHQVAVKNVSTEPVSWANLNKMHPGELASEEDLKNVVGDEDDSPVSGSRISQEVREKARKLEVQARDDTRMDQVMRQLDRKMESGYKTLKRSKAV